MYEQLIKQIKNPLEVYSKISNDPEDIILLSITTSHIRPQGWKLYEICSEMIAKKILTYLQRWIEQAGYKWDQALIGKAVKYTEQEIAEIKQKQIEIINSKPATNYERPWSKPITWGT